MSAESDFIISGPDSVFISPICKRMSLGIFALEILKQKGKSVAMIDATSGEVLTHEEIMKKSLQLADSFQRRGYRRGDIISISSENRMEYPILIIAATMLGITVSTINPLYSEGELHHIFSLTHPVAVFCSPFTSSNIIEMGSKFPCIREIFVFDYQEEIVEPKRIYSFQSLLSSGDENSVVLPSDDFSDDVAIILTSSGTTGMPKGVMLSHFNLIFLLEASGEKIKLFPQFEPIVMALVPFFHGYGILLILQSLTTQVKLVVLPNFDEKSFLSSIEKYKITHIPAVPPLLIFLAKSPLVEKYDLSSVIQIWSGAAPVGKYTLEEVGRRLNVSMDNIKQGYGMTELTILATSSSPETPSEAVGNVMPGMKLKIIDLETGKPLGVGKEGELCFHGPMVMKGYINNPKETQNTIDKEGWLHTGDIGYYDENRNLYIVDRLKELIKVKGFQVAPAELEGLLTKHPDVQDAAVIGKPDELSGEVPLAFVVKKPQTNVTGKILESYIADLVSPQKRLKGGVIFVDEIPKNPSGKILRRVLRDQLKKQNLSKL